MTKRSFFTGALIVAAIAVWTFAGLRTGYTIGRGWRGAVIEQGCRLDCRSFKL